MKNTYTIINKSLMAVKGGGTYSKIEPNIFEAIKAECISDAKGSLSKFLPYSRIDIPHDLPELEKWRNALTSDNSPMVISFQGKSDELFEAIKDIDLSKPFNKNLADEIRAKFPARPEKKIIMDADLMIQGELGELEDKK